MLVRIAPFVFAVAGSSVGLWSASAQVLAFPEAEGFGRYATGARANLASASVYHVTNLNDSGAGSLRDALSASNRVVVFDVGGIINLSSVVTVASNIYIAGQTAPGGIGVYNNRVAFHGANNLISRYWNVRLGTAIGREDAASLVRGQNMIWDHMSISWGVDGTFDINPDSGQIIDNITIQNSSVSQGLDVVGHSTGGLLTIGQGSRSSIIKSLWADNVTRNPKLRGDNEFINNVVYGYQTSGYIMGDTTGMYSNANAIGNYFIEGPVDGSSPFASGTGSFSIYGNDNWVDGDKDGVLDGSAISSYPGANVVATPHAFPTTTTMTAQQAVQFVMENFGPNITRDAVDTRLAAEVASYGTLGGVIVRDSDLFPNYGTDPIYLNPRARLADTDADGMPDNWETSRGLNPNSNADWKGLNVAGYTRLEEYLNELGGYGNTRTAPATGAWTTAATWGGTVPDFASTAVAANGVSHSSGNGFARQAKLDGTITVTGGTLDVFDTATVGSSANGTMTLSNGTFSAGRVLLGATGRTATFTMTGGTLRTGTIASGGGTGSLNLNGGTILATGVPNIAAPTSIGGSGVVINTNGFSGAITGGLSGVGTLTKSGSGALTLGGVNTSYSGRINLNTGTLALATSAANSSTGTITAANSTTLLISTSGASTPLTLAGGATVTLTGGGLTYNGAISGPTGTTLKVSTTSTGNFSLAGSMSGFSGTVDFSLTTGNVRLGDIGSTTARFDLGSGTAALRSTTGNRTVHLGSLVGGATATLQGSTNDIGNVNWSIGALNLSTTFSGLITDGVWASGAGPTSITKVGTGTLTLANAASTHTGATTLSGGILSVATINDGGVASSIGQSTAAAANLVFDGGTLRYTGNGATIDRTFTITQNGGAIDASGGNLEFRDGGASIALVGSGNRTLTLTGSNTGWNTLDRELADPASGKTTLAKSGTGTWRLLNTTSTFSGGVNISGGTLIAWSTGTIPTGAGKGNVSITGTGILDGNGAGHTINGLDGNGKYLHNANTQLLTLGNGNASGSFSGTIQVTVGGGTLGLVKIGTGVQTLSGTSNHNGTTTAVGGSLVLKNTAKTPVIAAGRYGITNGGLMVLDYSDTGNTSTWGAEIISDLTANHASGFLAGKIRTTLAMDGNKAIGWLDDAGNMQFKVRYTHKGDVNLNGLVDSVDFGSLLAGYGKTSGAVWKDGDFNYDGKSNTEDFNWLAGNFGSAALSSELPAASLGALIPEPASMTLALTLGAWGLMRRSRR